MAFMGCVEFRRVVHLVVEALAQQQGAQFTCFPGTKAQTLTLRTRPLSPALLVQPLRYY